MVKSRHTGETTAQIHARVYATRLDRLRKLIDLEFDGKLSELVAFSAMERPRSMSSFLSQLLSSNRPLGEQASRKIEVACGKPAGWLDGCADPVMTKREDDAAERAKRLKRFVKREYAGSLSAMAEAESLGARRQVFLSDVLKGTRYLSFNNAKRLEDELGIVVGVIAGKPEVANEPV